MLGPKIKWLRSFSSIPRRFIHRELKEPRFDMKYLTDPSKLDEISSNIQSRKGVGDIKLVQELHNKLQSQNLQQDKKIKLEEELKIELNKIPNRNHPDVVDLDTPKVVQYYNVKPEFKHSPLEFSEICKKLNILRTDHLGNFTGPRSYYLMSDLAELVRRSF